VCIQVIVPDEDQPPSPLARNMLAYYESGLDTDVNFDVDREIFRAHSQILQANAPILSDFCKNCNRTSEASVTIHGIAPMIFQLLLRFIYAGEMPDVGIIIAEGRSIIEAADKFELIKLKIATETQMVKNCVVDKTNAADYILFADARSCPLLKEYAISLFMLYAPNILRSEHSKNLRESAQLLEELLYLSTSGALNQQVSSAGTKSTKMGPSVTELRKDLAEQGLNVDGPKGVLFSRLHDAPNDLIDDEQSDYPSDGTEPPPSDDDLLDDVSLDDE
jgi:hypothetical protein